MTKLICWSADLQLSHRRANHPLRVPNDGASGERSASGSHAFGWRDAMDILVRWRQLSEPNDQVRFGLAHSVLGA
jgi:hypothetical protein